MKTAISLPDDLFGLAEAAARRLNLSRSELYAKALAEFLERRQEEDVADRLNRIYGEASACVDSALHFAQIQTLKNNSW